MRIVCPSCAANYEIADGMLVRPRTVRCSRCAREWMQEPDVIPVSVPPKPEPKPAAALLPVSAPPATPPPADPLAAGPLAAGPLAAAPPVELVARVPATPKPVTEVAPAAAGPQRDKGGARLTLAWIGSILALAILAFVAYRYRAEIQLAWPPSTRLFGLLPA